MSPTSDRLRLLLRVSVAPLIVGAAIILAALKLGYAASRETLLVGFVVALLAVLAVLLVLALHAAAAGRRPVLAGCEAVTVAGLLGVFGFGLANWGASVQGAVVVMERTPVSLANDENLAGLAMGPFSDPRDRRVTLGLARLRLEGVGTDRFRGVSSLRVLPDGGEERGITVAAGSGTRAGNLVFHQGVFGFAPRVVVTRGGATLLDANVPFRTVRDGDAISFVEDFEIASERLLLHGAVTLEDLTDDMKGHPRLELAIERAGALVGKVSLRPGEFVDLDGGLRVGFAGLQRWSEILFSRPRHGRAVVASAFLAAVGAIGWAVTARRRP